MPGEGRTAKRLKRLNGLNGETDLKVNGENGVKMKLQWTPNHWIEQTAASVRNGLIAAAVHPLR